MAVLFSVGVRAYGASSTFMHESVSASYAPLYVSVLCTRADVLLRRAGEERAVLAARRGR